MNKYKIKTLQESIIQFIVYLLFAAFYITLVSLFLNNPFIKLILIIIILRLTFYHSIDFLFTKNLVIDEDGKKFIKVFFLKLLLSKNTYLKIDTLFNLGAHNIKIPSLVLVRNEDEILKRFFKNKIKINVITSYNIKEIEAEAIKIADFLNVPFVYYK